MSGSPTDGENTPQQNNDELLSRLQIPDEVRRLMEEMPEPQQKAVQALLVAFSVRKSSFRSPIPPPDILKEYNEVILNGAERILTMAEEQSKHRMALESSVIKEQQRQGSKGQNFGFILGVIGILATILMACMGHDAVAGIFGTTTIIGLVGVFVIGKYKQSKNSDEKKDT